MRSVDELVEEERVDSGTHMVFLTVYYDNGLSQEFRVNKIRGWRYSVGDDQYTLDRLIIQTEVATEEGVTERIEIPVSRVLSVGVRIYNAPPRSGGASEAVEVDG
jgi:hypothetical protein